MPLLTRSDLAGLLDMRKAIKLTEATPREPAAGQVRPHEPLALRTGGEDLRVNLGALAERQIAVPRGRTVFRESQGGLGDVPLLHWLYERAKELGRG